MSIELCKFAGGPCNLCGDAETCMRTPPIVDVATAREFMVRKRFICQYPTCDDFEPYFHDVFDQVKNVEYSNDRKWLGLTQKGEVILRIHPIVSIDLSAWYKNSCSPKRITVFEKNPYRKLGGLSMGARNGLAEYGDVPFAVDIMDNFRVTRPVISGRRKELFNQIVKFRGEFETIYNSL